MPNKETIFFFEKLNFFNLFFIFFLKVFFFRKKFFYRNSSIRFNYSFLLKIIKTLNIIHLNYKKTGYDNFIKNFVSENVSLTKSVLLKIKTNANYNKLIIYYNYKKNNKEIFDIYLSRLLGGNYLTEGASSIRLLNYNFKNSTKIFYFPESLGNFLICKEQNNKNIKPIILIVFFKTLIRIFKHCLSFRSHIYKKNLRPKILFCPNQGLKFGKSFKKNFIFKDIQSKKFNNDEILVADYNHECKITKRYYKTFKINEIKFFNFNKYNFLNLIYFITKILKFNFSQFYYNCFLMYAFNDLQNCIKFLKNYKNLKAAVFSYDINANPTLVMACKVLNIRSFSFQERTNSYSFSPYMYFDEYYISGPSIKKMFYKNLYKFDKINIRPLSRSFLIKDNFIKNKKKIICLPPPVLDRLTRYNYGDIFSNEKRSLFYEMVLDLSKHFPDVSFLIKEKFSSKDIIISEFSKKIKKLQIKNISILEDVAKNSLYKIINNSQVLFGNYSSFFDECFTVKKPIILYDQDFQAFEHPLKYTNLCCKNLLDIKKNLKIILSKKIIDNKKTMEIRNDYFPNFDNKNQNVYSDIIGKINHTITLNDKL